MTTPTQMTPAAARAAILAGTAPDNLHVTSDLDLSRCTGLTSLPEGLNVTGDLYLSGCTGLTSLPAGINVGGYLDLSRCTGLTSLPEGLNVTGDHYLSGCTGLTSLPAGINVGGDLYLGGCTGLVSVGDHPVATPEEANARLRVIADQVAANPAVLHMETWHHPCGTAHCLAGTAIHNEGKAGYDLEKRYGPSAAGAILLGIDTIKMFTVSDAEAAKWLTQFETPKEAQS